MIFNIFILTLIVCLLFLILQVLLKNNKLLDIGNKKQIILKERLILEKLRNQKISDHISLLETLNSSLIQRFLKINQDLILLFKIHLNSN